MSLGRKLARLSGPQPAVPPVGARAGVGVRESAPVEQRGRPPQRSLLDELRAKMDVILSRQAAPRLLVAVEQPELPFFTEETPLGVRHRRILRLPASHRVGRASVLPSRGADASLLALLALDPGLAACPPEGALYLDTETTGLAGGAGTVAFLVGLAFWDQGELVCEQLLVRTLGEEAPMLAHVAERIAAASMLVTFNGKSFDMPLLRTRYVLSRLPAPVEPPHLDLLHVARRIHKSRRTACRLIMLEDAVLGFVRENDVPSGEVSACYLHFLRSGETSALLRVIEHNLWDVVTMASLVGLYGEPLEGTQLVADDLAGASRVLRRAGATSAARAFAEAAVVQGGSAETLRARAEIAKVLGDRDRALSDLHAVLDREDDPRARLELSKLYEHHKKDVVRALEFVEAGTGEKEEALVRRRRRLTRKVEQQAEKAPLFATRTKISR